MAGGAPGANSRGRGGKFKKYTRGGGKHFSRNLRPLDADGNEISMWSEDAQKQLRAADEESEEESEEESDEDEEDEGGAAGTSSMSAAELSREERKREKKARKEAAIARAKKQAVQVGDLPPSDSEEESDDDNDDMPANPNHSRQARSQTKAPEVDEAADGVQGLSVGAPSRRERESLQAAQAKERYRKLHEAGKTDEAKADLARLKLIREKREAEAARRQAEKEEKEAQEKQKRAEIEAREAKRREAALGPKKPKKK
ncbi:28 kDa heat- and acid-stable phosphoprotein [Madurella mycetomatis]|uniref:28 kDa heat- and acid-stable phosphoprotein n=1 Tax=Madurella mycetomatis TaxID=100816 RepID=A0A175WEY1_9PEZI|nr:28 kDa heat- and acid-stable phosphoprotein [Madurella mycetomatis]